MKKAIRKIVLCALAVTIAAFAAVFAGCAANPDAIVGEGAIAPAGYKKVEIANSSFYIPQECAAETTDYGTLDYTFSEGKIRANAVSSRAKVQRIKRNTYEQDLKRNLSVYGLNCTLDDFKFYKLDNLWILASEFTVVFRDDSAPIKEYQFVYNSSGKQVTVTVVFNNVDTAVESDVPAKLLYSIALDD